MKILKFIGIVFLTTIIGLSITACVSSDETSTDKPLPPNEHPSDSTSTEDSDNSGTIKERVVVNVTVDKPLSSLIDKSKMFRIEDLKITGKITDADLSFLREMCSCYFGGEDERYTIYDGTLKIDISGATFVKTNNTYFSYITKLTDLNGNPAGSQYDNYGIGHHTYIANNGFTEVKDENDGLNYLFFGGVRLRDITLPNSITKIGWRAFEGCTNLASITLPNSVTEIGGSAFFGCTSLASITLPNSVTEIGSRAFEDCTSLASITLPNSVTEIGNAAFYNCKSLVSITLPNSITDIGYESTFGGCTSLESITLPNSIKRIGNETFYNCKSLVSITLPNSITEIGSRAFFGCEKLNEIHIKSKTPPTLETGNDIGDETFPTNRYGEYISTLYIPKGSKEAYNKTPWNKMTIKEE